MRTANPALNSSTFETFDSFAVERSTGKLPKVSNVDEFNAGFAVRMTNS